SRRVTARADVRRASASRCCAPRSSRTRISSARAGSRGRKRRACCCATGWEMRCDSDNETWGTGRRRMTEVTKHRGHEPAWPIAFFDDDYLRIYRPMLTEERTLRETDFIESALGLAAGATVLDLACGFGRHAIGMARRGFRVTGVDFNTRYLQIAREASVQ